jgi:GGDEF domain-containing protein
MGSALILDADAAVLEVFDVQELSRQMQKCFSPIETLVKAAECGSKLGVELWQVASCPGGTPMLLTVASRLPSPEALSSYLTHFCLAADNMLGEQKAAPSDWHRISPQVSWLMGEATEGKGWPEEYRDFCIKTGNDLSLVRCSGGAGMRGGGEQIDWRSAQLVGQAVIGRLTELVRGAQTNLLRDPVSGVYSEEGFFEALEREVERTRRHAIPLSVAALEVCALRGQDHLLEKVHRSLGDHLHHQVRQSDLVGRVGNLSYGVLLYHTGPRNALIVAGRIADALRGDELLNGVMTFSLGVSGWDCSGPEGLTLLSQARRAAAEAAVVAPGRPFIYI